MMYLSLYNSCTKYNDLCTKVNYFCTTGKYFCTIDIDFCTQINYFRTTGRYCVLLKTMAFVFCCTGSYRKLCALFHSLSGAPCNKMMSFMISWIVRIMREILLIRLNLDQILIKLQRGCRTKLLIRA